MTFIKVKIKIEFNRICKYVFFFVFLCSFAVRVWVKKTIAVKDNLFIFVWTFPIFFFII